VPRLKTEGGKSELAVPSLFSGTSLEFKWDFGFSCHFNRSAIFSRIYVVGSFTLPLN